MNGGNATRRYKSKVSVKIAWRFLAIAIIPLVVIGFVLVQAASGSLRSEAEANQQTYATDRAYRVDTYLDTAAGQLSYAAGLIANNPQALDQSLSLLFKKNPDLAKAEVLLAGGKVRTATLEGNEPSLSSSRTESDNTALDALVGKQRVLTISRNNANMPRVGITLPILDATGKLIGSITGSFDIADSWKAMLPEQKSGGTYAYVIDGKGALVYHPDKNLLSLHPNLSDVGAVRDFMGNTLRTRQTDSEEKHAVLSTARSTKAGLGVIAEQPIEQAYESFYEFIELAILAILIALLVAIAFALAFAKRTASPIKKVAAGARSLAAGTLTKRLTLKTNDELQETIDILNDIGSNMSQLVGKLESSNRNLMLEQSELHSIINNVNDGVIAVDARGEIVSINASALRLMPAISYDVRGKLITEIFPWTRDGSPLQLDFVTAGVRVYDNIVLAKDETVSYLDLNVEVVDRDKNNVAAIITIHDQTASRELSFMKLDFVAIATHELRTPLTVIMGYLDMLNREADKELSAENVENLKRAITGAQQLRELISKLLNIARIERGDMEIFLDKLNVTQLAKQNVEEHQQIAAQKNQSLVYTANTDTDVYAPADTTSIAEVLNNLIGNALKYTPRGGQVRVHVTVNTTDLRVEVTDNGPGIPEEMRANLFSKFYRAERSMIAGTRGTGLGLFISKTIIELQNGTIGVTANSGDGSTFYFTLPIYQADRDDALIEKNISRGKHGWFKKRSAH